MKICEEKNILPIYYRNNHLTDFGDRIPEFNKLIRTVIVRYKQYITMRTYQLYVHLYFL